MLYCLLDYCFFFFFSSRRRHTRFDCDWSSDVCSSDLCARRGGAGLVSSAFRSPAQPRRAQRSGRAARRRSACARAPRAEQGVTMAFAIPRVGFPKPGEPGARRSRVVWLFGSAFLVLLIGYNSCTTYVHPGQAGVKQIKFGMGKGIDPLVYGVGLHYVGFGETMHRFPTRLQVLELTNSRSEQTQDDVEGHRTT